MHATTDRPHDTTDTYHARVLARVPAHIVAALAELDETYDTAAAMPHACNVERADRALRLARVSARRAAWWRVLARWTYRSGLHNLHGRAALHSADLERDRARFWRDTAADWRARAERRPTSDAAGALSNWDELEVTA